MLATVIREKFNQALQTLNRVATNRGQLPILSSVLITIKDSKVSLSATNLELAVVFSIGGKIEKEGSVAVPAKLLADFVSNLSDDSIQLDLQETSLKVSSKSSVSTIQGSHGSDFPAIPESVSKTKLTLNCHDLKTGLSKVIIATSNDDTRPILTGVSFSRQENKIILAATDSYRLVENKISSDGPDVSPIVIPSKSVQELLRTLPEDGTVNMYMDENQIKFIFGDIEIVSRLIDAEFPNYQSLIPQKSETNILVKTQNLLRITKIASLFAKESAGSITLKADQESQQIEINSIASQIGENTSTAQAKIDIGGEVVLNSQYLIDALTTIDSDEVEFRFSGRQNPCVITPFGSLDHVQLIMPLRS